MIHANSKSGPQHSCPSSLPQHFLSPDMHEIFLPLMSFFRLWTMAKESGSNSPGWWHDFSIIKVYVQLKERGLVHSPQHLHWIWHHYKKWEECSTGTGVFNPLKTNDFTTKWPIASKNYTNPTGGGIEAMPGTLPAALTSKKKKAASSLFIPNVAKRSKLRIC